MHTATLVLARSNVLVVLAIVAAAGCVNELNPHTREADADHNVAFVAQDDTLNSQLTTDAEGYRVTPVIDRRGEPFNRIGVRYDVAGPVVAEGRARHDDSWSDWSELTSTYVDDSAHNGLLDVEADSDGAQLRFKLDDGASLRFLVTETFVFEPAAADVDLEVDAEAASEDLQGLAADGLVVTRSQWGARSRSCGPTHQPNRLTIHHTDTPNNDSISMPARVRQIQNYHINTRGWCDVGYHFLIGQDARVYQGRVENVLGAHAAGANTDNVGISFIGTFDDAAPSPAMLDAAARIMKSMSRTYGIALNRDRVQGHRQVGTTDTSCPGDALYNGLSDLISRAQGSTGGSTGGTGGTDSTTSACSLVEVDTDTLNIRPDANTSRAPIGSLTLGQTATRLASVTGQSVNGTSRWYRVQRGSVVGYISGAYASCAN